MSLLAINHIHYRRPLRPCVAVCIDGSDPSYLARYLSRGELPNIARFIREGFAGTAQSSVPAFTCPNNMSIITGVPVSQHGISGNYYLESGRERVCTSLPPTPPDVPFGIRRFLKSGCGFSGQAFDKRL